MIITVAARSSPLSKIQVEEALQEIRTFHPNISFDVHYLKTTGDIDLKTPLPQVDQSDFFTKEIDQLQISGKVQLSVHSAKDLPDPLPLGLKVICLTQGVDPRDSLVLPEGKTVQSLPPFPRIGTSSLRRQEAIRALRSDAKHVDIRGTIGARLDLLKDGTVDALIVAEAALIRLNLTHLNRIFLEADPAPLQGKLALVARADDIELETLFSPMDTRKRVAVFGPEPLYPVPEVRWIHQPLIDTIELSVKIPQGPFDAAIFTSKTTVQLMSKYPMPKRIFCVGAATGALTKALFPESDIVIAEEEQQEGLIKAILNSPSSVKKVLWPHSTLSRPLLKEELERAGIEVTALPIYDTKFKQKASLDFSEIDEVLFTSPSTVEAFFRQSKAIPKSVMVSAIGPVTLKKLKEALCLNPILCPICPTTLQIFSRQSQPKSCSCTTPSTMLPM